VPLRFCYGPPFLRVKTGGLLYVLSPAKNHIFIRALRHFKIHRFAESSSLGYLFFSAFFILQIAFPQQKEDVLIHPTQQTPVRVLRVRVVSVLSLSSLVEAPKTRGFPTSSSYLIPFFFLCTCLY
jgi:hypothetical protein